MSPTVIAIGGGSLSAAASLAALTGSPLGTVLAYFAPLPLLMVGLGLGVTAGLIACATGLVAAAGLGGVPAAGIYGGIHAVPSWIVVRQAIGPRTASGQPAAVTPPAVGAILCSLALMAALLAVAAVMLSGGATGIEASVRALIDAALTATMPQLDADNRSALVEHLSPLFAGGFGATWMLMLIVNATIAQAMLSSRGWNIQPTPRWSGLTLPEWFSWILVTTAVVALVAGGDFEYVARNLVVIFAVPYFFLGLSVVHCIARRFSARRLVLVVFYTILIVFFISASVVVSALGLAEQWAGVRRRFGAPANS